jgi:hypothetical protein
MGRDLATEVPGGLPRNTAESPEGVRLRLDSWEPDYGTSSALDEAVGEAVPEANLAVEGPWLPRRPEGAGLPTGVAFIDGVRRIEARLFAETAGGVAPAVAGAWAVGVVRLGEGGVGPLAVGRTLVVGGGLHHPPLTIPVGSGALVYQPAGVAGSGPLDVVQGLQTRMREEEAALARAFLREDRPPLLLLDGPLTYLAGEDPVVGVIKRQSRAYLPPQSAPILGVLEPGERTPLFLIGDQRLERYAWYTRIARGREIDGALTGILRLEVSTAVGLDRARTVADATTLLLPGLASDRVRDPRAPQNLYPVGRLEAVLRHRLGDASFIRRGIETALWRGRG